MSARMLSILQQIIFCGNNQETNRQTINEMISERAMQEIYLPAFRACVQKGRVGSVMTAYNWINGQACAHNEQLIDGTLRAKWKFDGVVVSDWGVYTIRLLH